MPIKVKANNHLSSKLDLRRRLWRRLWRQRRRPRFKEPVGNVPRRRIRLMMTTPMGIGASGVVGKRCLGSI